MNIGELFVELGIKGGDKTVGTLSSIKKGLGDIRDTSFETKAAIAAAVYGLERLMSASAQTGTNLTNFEAITGLSTQTLQKWQYATQQAGGTAEELTGTVRSVQNAMTDLLLGKGNPEGLGWLERMVGFDPKKAKDTFYVLEKLQEFAKAAPPELAAKVIKSFGVSEGVLAAMRRNMYRDDIFARAPRYSKGEAATLDKVNISWGNLGRQIQMALGHLNAKHGLTIINDISKAVTETGKLVDKLLLLAEALKVFEKLSTVMGALSSAIGTTTDVASIGLAHRKGDDISDKELKNSNDAKLRILDLFANVISSMQQTTLGKAWTPTALVIDPKVLSKLDDITHKKSAPIVQQTNHINANFNHDGSDYKKAGKDISSNIPTTFKHVYTGQKS